VSKATGLCVTTDATTLRNSGAIYQGACAQTTGQQWQLTMVGSLAVISSSLSTVSPPPVWDSSTAPQIVMTAPSNGAWKQWAAGKTNAMPATLQWTPTALTDGNFTFTDNAGQCLTAGAGTTLTVAACTAGSPGQEFAIHP
jgi:hypothetical protein